MNCFCIFIKEESFRILHVEKRYSIGVGTGSTYYHQAIEALISESDLVGKDLKSLIILGKQDLPLISINTFSPQ